MTDPRPEEIRLGCPCALFARATEWAALAGARWLGRADQDAAEDAAEGAMLAGLAALPIDGTIVIGADGAEELEFGSTVGIGGEAFDLAVDPLEGRGVVARGGNGAMSMIAVGAARARCCGCPTCTCAAWRSARAREAAST